MVTIDALKSFGANTDEGLARCVNMEALYLKLVNTAASDEGYDKLQSALDAHDFSAAFDAAHGLKGVLANLALTPILEPVAEVTELLRAGKDMDYSSYMNTILQKRDELKAICS